MRCWLETQL
jgi:predicted ester cyclase